MVSVLDPDLQSSGTHCTHCLRAVEVENAVIPSFDRIDSIFCSSECETKCKYQAQNLLFGRDPVIPLEFNPTAAIPGAQEMRNAAQVEFAAFIKSATKSGPMLVARYAGRQGALI
jgi:import receptor subunit TOM20